MKKRVKKNRGGTPPNSAAIKEELFPPPQGSKPLESKFARTAQLAAQFPFAKIDENLLRRLSPQWFPKAIGGKWDVAATTRGLWAYAESRAERSAGLPTFASMELCESAGHIPRKIQKQMTKLGVVFTRPGCGIDFDALLRGIEQHILLPISAGDGAKLSALGIGGIATIDGAYEEDRLTRERADEQAMLNAEKRGELLFSSDQQTAIGELRASEVLFEQFLAPFKKEMLALAKREGFYDHITALLAKHLKNLPPEMVEKLETGSAKSK